MRSSKFNRREVLAVTGTTVAGIAVASLLPPSASAKTPDRVSDPMSTHVWLLETGKPVLDADLRKVVSSQMGVWTSRKSGRSRRGPCAASSAHE